MMKDVDLYWENQIKYINIIFEISRNEFWIKFKNNEIKHLSKLMLFENSKVESNHCDLRFYKDKIYDLQRQIDLHHKNIFKLEKNKSNKTKKLYVIHEEIFYDDLENQSSTSQQFLNETTPLIVNHINTINSEPFTENQYSDKCCFSCIIL